MILTLYVILLVVAGGSLFFGIKTQKWLLTMLSLIIFLTLSFQSYQIEVVSGGTVLKFVEPVMILINWFGSFVSFGATLYGAIQTWRLKKSDTRKYHPHPASG